MKEFKIKAENEDEAKEIREILRRIRICEDMPSPCRYFLAGKVWATAFLSDMIYLENHYAEITLPQLREMMLNDKLEER